MNHDPSDRALYHRRQIIKGLAVTTTSVAASLNLWAKSQSHSTSERSQANQARTFLHQEVSFTTTAARIYELLLDSKQFPACASLPAEINPKAGGAFSTFGGLIVGRNVELLPSQHVSFKRGVPPTGKQARIQL